VVVFSTVQQNGSEDGGGQDQAAAEQERGRSQADATRHCSSSSVRSRCHGSYQGNTKMSTLLIINFFSAPTNTIFLKVFILVKYYLFGFCYAFLT